MVHPNSLWAKNENQKSSSKCSSMYTGVACVRCVRIAQNAYSAFQCFRFNFLQSWIILFLRGHWFTIQKGVDNFRYNQSLWYAARVQRSIVCTEARFKLIFLLNLAPKLACTLDSIERNELYWTSYVKYMWKEDSWNYELWKDFRLINKDNFLVHHNHVDIHIFR